MSNFLCFLDRKNRVSHTNLGRHTNRHKDGSFLLIDNWCPKSIFILKDYFDAE